MSSTATTGGLLFLVIDHADGPMRSIVDGANSTGDQTQAKDTRRIRLQHPPQCSRTLKAPGIDGEIPGATRLGLDQRARSGRSSDRPEAPGMWSLHHPRRVDGDADDRTGVGIGESVGHIVYETHGAIFLRPVSGPPCLGA